MTWSFNNLFWAKLSCFAQIQEQLQHSAFHNISGQGRILYGHHHQLREKVFLKQNEKNLPMVWECSTYQAALCQMKKLCLSMLWLISVKFCKEKKNRELGTSGSIPPALTEHFLFYEMCFKGSIGGLTEWQIMKDVFVVHYWTKCHYWLTNSTM